MCGEGCLKIVGGQNQTEGYSEIDDGFCDGVECGGVSPEMAKKIIAARQSDSDAGIDNVPVTDEVAEMVEKGTWRHHPH